MILENFILHGENDWAVRDSGLLYQAGFCVYSGSVPLL